MQNIDPVYRKIFGLDRFWTQHNSKCDPVIHSSFLFNPLSFAGHTSKCSVCVIIAKQRVSICAHQSSSPKCDAHKFTHCSRGLGPCFVSTFFIRSSFCAISLFFGDVIFGKKVQQKTRDESMSRASLLLVTWTALCWWHSSRGPITCVVNWFLHIACHCDGAFWCNLAVNQFGSGLHENN